MGDVDTQARTVSFNRQLDRRGQRVELKTKRSTRRIAITPDLAAALTEHRLACGRPPSSALVFTRPDGTAHSHASADRALRMALTRAGIDSPPTWHALRHSHVSRLFAAGADPV